MTFAQILANERAARSEYDIIFREMHDEPNEPGTVAFRTWMITTELDLAANRHFTDLDPSLALSA